MTAQICVQISVVSGSIPPSSFTNICVYIKKPNMSAVRLKCSTYIYIYIYI